MADTIALGRLIRESRLKQGMSLGQLAAAVGRSSSSVRRWERGEVPPASGIIDDLAEALDIDADELRKLRPQPITAVAHADALGAAETTGEAPYAEPKRSTTLEQPVVRNPESGIRSPESEARPLKTGPGAVIPADAPEQRQRGFFGDVVAVIVETFTNWSGWIRGLLTLAALVAMLFVLAWALGELFSALGEVWDSFGVG